MSDDLVARLEHEERAIRYGGSEGWRLATAAALRDAIAALAAERQAREQAEHAEHVERLEGGIWKRAAEQAEQERDRLQAALTKFGVHDKETCSAWIRAHHPAERLPASNYPCSCGLDAALSPQDG
jgi:Zn-dependent oligopeptidase